MGLEKPQLLLKSFVSKYDVENQGFLKNIVELAEGKSTIDVGTLREGIVVWFKTSAGDWDCLKYKSEEFLIRESELRDQEVGDVEDNL